MVRAVRRSRRAAASDIRGDVARALLLCLLVSACSHAPRPYPAEAPHPLTAWRVEGNGLARPSYVFGTMHTYRGYGWYTPELEAMIDAVEVVALETNEATQRTEAELYARRARYGAEDGPLMHLPEALYLEVQAHLKANRLYHLDLDRQLPWAVAFGLGLEADFRAGYTGTFGAETVIEARAVQRGLPIEALETAEEHVATLADADREEVIADLRGAMAMARSPQYVQGRKLMAEAWARGDVVTMERVLAESPRSPRAHRRWIDDRNDRMLARGLVHIRARPTLIAVGASHVVGPRGLVVQLRALGYTLTQLWAR